MIPFIGKQSIENQTAKKPESSIILLKTQPLFDPGPQIQMPSVGYVEPFADPPDQRIGMRRAP